LILLSFVSLFSDKNCIFAIDNAAIITRIFFSAVYEVSWMYIGVHRQTE
jgi:hypothetical protein